MYKQLLITLMLGLASTSALALETFLKTVGELGGQRVRTVDQALGEDDSMYFVFRRLNVVGGTRVTLDGIHHDFDRPNFSFVAKLGASGQWEWVHAFVGDYEDITIQCIDVRDGVVAIGGHYKLSTGESIQWSGNTVAESWPVGTQNVRYRQGFVSLIDAGTGSLTASTQLKNDPDGQALSQITSVALGGLDGAVAFGGTYSPHAESGGIRAGFQFDAPLASDSSTAIIRPFNHNANQRPLVKFRQVPIVGQFNVDLTRVLWARQFISGISDGFANINTARSAANAHAHAHISRVRVDGAGNTYFSGRVSCGFVNRNLATAPGGTVAGTIHLNQSMGSDQQLAAIQNLLSVDLSNNAHRVYNSYLFGRFDADGGITGINYHANSIAPGGAPNSESILTDFVLTPDGGYATGTMRGTYLTTDPSSLRPLLSLSTPPQVPGQPAPPNPNAHDSSTHQRGFAMRFGLSDEGVTKNEDFAILWNGGDFADPTSRIMSRFTGIARGGNGDLYISGASLGPVKELITFDGNNVELTNIPSISPGPNRPIHFVLQTSNDLQEVRQLFTPSDPLTYPLPDELRFDGRSQGDGALVSGRDLSVSGSASSDRLYWCGEYDDGAVSWGRSELRNVSITKSYDSAYITGINFALATPTTRPPLLTQASLRINSPLPEMSHAGAGGSAADLIHPAPGIDLPVIVGGTVSISLPYQIYIDQPRDQNGVPTGDQTLLFERLDSPNVDPQPLEDYVASGAWPNYPRTRLTFDNYKVEQTADTGTENRFDVVIREDTTVDLNFRTEHALDVIATIAGADATDPILSDDQLRVLGNPSYSSSSSEDKNLEIGTAFPLDEKSTFRWGRTWIPAADTVQVDIGLDQSQPFPFGERFIVEGYSGIGSVPAPPSNSRETDTLGLEPFVMEEPGSLEITWRKQILVQLGALTEPAARDRVYVKAVDPLPFGVLGIIDQVDGDDWNRPFQDLNDTEAAARWFDYKQWLFVAAERSPSNTGVGLNGWLTAGGHFPTSQGTLDDLVQADTAQAAAGFGFSLRSTNDGGQAMDFVRVSGLVIEELTKPTFVTWNYGGAIFPVFQSIGFGVDTLAINEGRDTGQTVTVAEGQTIDTTRLSGDIDVNADPVISVVESPAPGTHANNAMAWDRVHKRLLPLRPGRFLVQFPATDLVQPDANANVFFEITSGFPGDAVSAVVDDENAPIVAFPLLGSDWPRDYKRAHYRHIGGAPGVALDASLTDDFAFNQLAYFQAEALTATAAAVPTAEAALVSDGQFTNSLPGRSVLVFSQSNLPDDPTSYPATGDTEREGLIVRVVETRWLDDKSWDDTGDLVSDGGESIVGTPISDGSDEAGLGTGWVVFDSEKLLINPNIYDRELPRGPIIPVNTRYRQINSADEVTPEEELIITWYENLGDESDNDPDINWPYQPKIYLSAAFKLPNLTDFGYTGRARPDSSDYFGLSATSQNIIYTASRMGSAGLKFLGAQGWVPQEDLFSKYDDIQVYQQPDREAQGYNPNEEHAFIADAIFSHPLDDNGDPIADEIELGNNGGSAKAVFALRNDLNLGLRQVYDEIAEQHDLNALDLDTYTSEPFVLVQYFDPEIEEHRMALYFIGHESDIYEYEYDTTVGIPVRAPYPVDQLVGFEGNDSNQLDNDSVIDGTYFVNADAASIGREQAVFWFDPVGVPWAISGPAPLNNTSPIDTTPHLYAGFYYSLRDDFWHPSVAAGDVLPWSPGLANSNTGNHPTLAADAPTTIRYNTVWPDNVATLKAGETLTFPGGEFKKDNPTLRNGDGELVETPGLPGVIGWTAGRLLFDSRSPAMREDLAAPENFTARLVNPLLEHAIPLAIADVSPAAAPKFEPADASIRVKGTRWFFNDLSASLQRRVSYDFILQKLTLQGFVNERAIGDANLTAAPDPVYVLEPNILTLPEAQEIAALFDDANWRQAVNTLYHLSRDPNDLVADAAALPASDEAPYLAGLSNKYDDDYYFDSNNRAPAPAFGSGLAVVPNANFLEYAPNAREGYITLVENAHPENPDLSPVTVHVIKVTPHERYRGAIKTVLSDNVFDEKIVLIHTGDFGGNLDDVVYEWYYKPAEAGDVGVPPGNGWNRLASTTANQITLQGDPILLLGDNLFFARYKHVSDTNYGGNVNTPFPWEWAGAGNSPQVQTDLSTKYLPQLAMGWVKRVLDRVNPYEARFNDFYNNESPATYTSLIQQAGAPPLGPVALNPDKNVIENLGLIELYKTVLDRAVDLSIETTAGNASIEQALLLGATRISFLYELLGNEAYSDAQDPTIGIQGGNLAPTVHAFQNLEASLLHEELALLRGTDFDMGWPVYNRLFWNFVKGEGEPAYAVNYNIKDVTSDGFINESDAKLLFPQGHGDAWGHYLSASKSLYTLLRHPRFNWEARQELYNLLDLVLETDYLDERSFARIAANKARAGAEIVHNTYRLRYEQDPDGQWHGYRDTDEARAWGVSESATRAYQASYFDWLTANSLLPYDARGNDDSSNQLDLIDRRSIVELKELAALASEIQNTMDNANNGLNPLGLVDGDVTFDINPSILGRDFFANNSHFDQLYQRAVQAGKNAYTAFEHANKQQNRLRHVADSTESARREASSQDRSYRNRLIALFGTPYEGTVGPGKLYPAGYDGPDLILFQYVDFNSADDFIPDESLAYRELYGYQLGGEFGLNRLFKTALGVAGLQNESYSLETLISDFTKLDGAKAVDGDTRSTRERVLAGSDFAIRDSNGDLIDLKVPIDPNALYGFKAPAEWGKRRVVGSIQQRIHDLVSTQITLKKSIDDYEGYLRGLRTSLSNHQASWSGKARGIRDQQLFLAETTLRESLLFGQKILIDALKTTKEQIKEISESVVEGLPKVTGVSSDVTSGARAAILAAKISSSAPLSVDDAIHNAIVNADKAAAKLKSEGLKLRNLVNSFKGAQRGFVYDFIDDLTSESTNRFPIADALADMQKRLYAFDAEVDKGVRLIAERESANRKVAATTQEGRYNDAILRINRNEALQHYHGALDTALRYAYMAAQAYDYETGLAPEDAGSVQTLLPELMRTRSLGLWSGGQPQIGRGGLGEWLGHLKANFDVLKTQLGLTNPQRETGRLSLRHEWARVKPDLSSDERWRKTLANHRVANLWEVPEFRQFCRPFASEEDGHQPGLVIPMSSEITSGLNFFGRELGGLDHAFDPSQYATKIASVGAWFTGYDDTGLSLTPRIYLVPAGSDVMRIANGPTLETREWLVRDRKIPIPFSVASSNLEDPDWLLSGSSIDGTFTDIRRFSAFRAYHDQGEFINEGEITYDSRLVGRSVWNTRWVLIIPGASFSADPDAGLDRFIGSKQAPGVFDIKLLLQTYSHSGN